LVCPRQEISESVGIDIGKGKRVPWWQRESILENLIEIRRAFAKQLEMDVKRGLVRADVNAGDTSTI
jgi:hypothetical protein